MADLICLSIAFAWIGYSVGYLRAQKRYIPEIVESREETARIRMLSKLKVCPWCDGQRNVYNAILESYVPCSMCAGTGEMKSNG